MMGSVYALFAVGMVLVFGVMRVLNFAQGAIFMAGGYICYAVFALAVPSYVLALLAAALGGAVLGVVLERAVFRRLRENLPMQIVASLGLVLIIQNGALLIFGPDAVPVAVSALRAQLHLG